MTDRELALIKAGRDYQRQLDAAALETSAQVLVRRGYSYAARTLMDAAIIIRGDHGS